MEIGKKRTFFNRMTLLTLGILLVLFLAVVLLWHGNATSSQAEMALVAQVYFDGKYRIEDGPWQEIQKGQHIPATKGDVFLEGNFHLVAPDGTYVGIYSGETPIAFYLDHINLTVSVEGEDCVVDMENPLFGDSVCGVGYMAYAFWEETDATVQLRIHNPHRFGNETAVDLLLGNLALWTGAEFEKDVLSDGEIQRTVGLLFLLASMVLLGTALFSTLIHNKNSRILAILGSAILFAGLYMSYSAPGVAFWNESIVSNTIILGCSMMFYMLFLSVTIVYFLKETKRVGALMVVALAVADGAMLLLPMVTQLRFYDLWAYWAATQMIANTLLFGCLIRDFAVEKANWRWGYIGFALPLVAFGVDVVMTGLGIWKGGVASAYVFVVMFVVAMIGVLKVIPQSINALEKTKELETEKILLNAQLTESRISTMMSQIRPHFIYNTLGSIEQLCSLDPPKAGELVHNFAKYLRGNFGELDNPKPILMSQEMAHVHHYISIENVRFPDMTFSFEMNSEDFHIPALTIQPIVENAIKHGLMKLPKGGTIRVVSYETQSHYCVSVVDDGVGFDTGAVLEDRKHLGIRNIRERLAAMVGGTLEIESAPGAGTKVLISIPKEVGE